MSLANIPLFPNPPSASPDDPPAMNASQAIEDVRRAWCVLEQAIAEFKDSALPALARANGLTSVRSVHIVRNYGTHAPAYDLEAVLDLPSRAIPEARIAAISAWAGLLGTTTRPGNTFVNGSSLSSTVKASVALSPQANLTLLAYVDLPIAAPEVMTALGLTPATAEKASADGTSATDGSNR